MKKLEPGDELVIHSLDRMSRDLIHTMTALQSLNDMGVSIRVLTMDFDSRTPIGRFVFAMMAAFAQFEREVINERSAHGLARARARGVTGGRAMKFTPAAVLATYEKTSADLPADKRLEKTAKKLACSVITVKRRLAEARAKKEEQADD